MTIGIVREFNDCLRVFLWHGVRLFESLNHKLYSRLSLHFLLNAIVSFPTTTHRHPSIALSSFLLGILSLPLSASFLSLSLSLSLWFCLCLSLSFSLILLLFHALYIPSVFTPVLLSYFLSFYISIHICNTSPLSLSRFTVMWKNVT